MTTPAETGIHVVDLFSDLEGDGCHHGPSELYPEHEARLIWALENLGPKASDVAEFDTGWFSSKHELASFSLSYDALIGEGTATASVTDDFDTIGVGRVTYSDPDRDAITKAWEKAWHKAEEDQMAHAPCAGFSIGPKSPDGKLAGWRETLLLPVGDYTDSEEPPPGDSYHKWGWQEEDEAITSQLNGDPDLREQMEDWAWDCHYGRTEDGYKAFGDLVIREWED